MKTLLKTLLLCAALAVMSGCSAQKRAERHVRKAVSLCPELVQTKAHQIDTVLTVGPWTDCTHVPIPCGGETFYAPTDHGTVVVSLDQTDGVLRVGFIAAPQRIRYRDTIRYAQVAQALETPKTEPRQRNPWLALACWMGGVVVGIVGLLIIALKTKVVD